MYIKVTILVLCIIIKYKNPHTGCFTGLYPTGGNEVHVLEPCGHVSKNITIK